ncbi:MAG: helix-turn-helix transcriptional regulator, partial [Patescibacteria group bacterium]
MDKPKSETPYKPLGKKLKELRSQANESLAEASGAVEIDVRQLASFELGQTRPTEDVLLLLLSHFGVKDDEALRLWEVAGYHMAKIPVVHMMSDPASSHSSSP